ncbi:VacJ family lipoprotein [Benzoatithermus flavus]|uniref:VacJ family lipoprotein n=1 Tax=Benzoatithermus flavus TaxID=3108223 RepID=A0ABU8XWK0_9PROT
MHEAVHRAAPARSVRARHGRSGVLALTLLAGLAPSAKVRAQETVWDPIEPVNRAVFGFNMLADEWVLEPVARGYRYVAPEPVRRSVGNFLANLRSPVIFVNDLLQGERERAGITLGRLMINTTLGVFGLFDAASTFGYLPHDEDLGQTLGVWGAPPGPYIMLPLLGPSNVRDAFGRVGDWAIDPLNNCCIDTDERLGRLGGSAISEREANIEVIDDLKRNSLDFYATVRTIYAQRRAADIRNGAAPPPGGQENYEDIFKDEGTEP